jgi:hypothetical protein
MMILSRAWYSVLCMLSVTYKPYMLSVTYKPYMLSFFMMGVVMLSPLS